MPKLLIKYTADYADEFNVDGFWACSEEEFNHHLETAADADYPCERYFGINESIEYDSFEDYQATLNVVRINDEEFETLIKLFGRGSYGIFPSPGE